MPRQKSPIPHRRVPHTSVPLLMLSAFVLSTGCDQDQDGDGWTVEQGDCDDLSATTYPGAPELCNGTDDDCDALVDADDPSVTLSTWYPDHDGDGKGSTSAPVQSCAAPAGYVASSGDCDDADPAVYPGALEVCNDLDNDCDLLADEDDPGLSGAYAYYIDADQDGYGSDNDGTVEACAPGVPDGYSSLSGDCADTNPAVNPAAFEYPIDGLDNDCDGHASAIIQIEGGGGFSLALDDLGRVWSWGYNGSGQLGDGTYTNRRSPVQVNGLKDIETIGAGLYHCLALRSDGTLWAWGSNSSGQLGTGGPPNPTPLPVRVELAGVAGIATGSQHSLALLGDGTVQVWGLSVACGTSDDCRLPKPVTGLSGVVSVAGGALHSLALLKDGTVRSWGGNEYGQLGDGTTNGRSTPVEVIGLAGVTQISAGREHSMALREDGTVQAWGYNDYGQLGDGTTTSRKTPVNVVNLDEVQSIAVGSTHSLALVSDGTIRAWGWNREGEVGDGTTTNRATPVKVIGLTNIFAIDGGSTHSLALRSDSTAWALGDNTIGQLGDGTLTSRKTPVQVVPPSP